MKMTIPKSMLIWIPGNTVEDLETAVASVLDLKEWMPEGTVFTRDNSPQLWQKVRRIEKDTSRKIHYQILASKSAVEMFDLMEYHLSQSWLVVDTGEEINNIWYQPIYKVEREA